MLEQLEPILVDLDADRAVRVVLVTAAGDRSFCAGADVKRFKALPPLDMWAQWTRRGLRVFDHLAGLRQPTIAAVSGNAYGGGFELALACDLRILADDATLGLTEVGIGTLPGWGGTGRLRDLVGAGRAKELIFTGEPRPRRPLPGDREPARREGGGLPVPGLATMIAGRAPIAVQMAKQAIDSGDAYRADGTDHLGGHGLHRRCRRRAGLVHREARTRLQRQLNPPPSHLFRHLSNRSNHP